MQNIIKRYFDLRSDQENEQEIAEDIRQGCEFKGTNLWALVTAILIASVGLNTNSTAVIIGAMLISPLMGPIVGAGFALATVDFELLKTAGRNFLTFVLISLATSVIYFGISPLDDPTAEIVARTYPTIYDVLIAFFGGVAGIVAYTRKTKGGNIIPGVAIATALMPPLCTAGFGLARLDFLFFAGALYLFVINSVMIAVATMAVTRLVLRSRRRQYEEEATRQRVTRIIVFLITVTVLPSLWLAYTLVQKNNYDKRAQDFLSREVEALNIPILKTTVSYNDRSIEIFSLGEPDSLTRLRILERLNYYDLQGTVVRYRSAREYIVDKERQHRSQAEQQMLLWRDSVTNLNKRLTLSDQERSRQQRILTELMALDSNITAFGPVALSTPKPGPDSLLTILIAAKAAPTPELDGQLKRFLEARFTGKKVAIHWAVPEPSAASGKQRK